MRVALIIVNYNSAPDTLRCLQSIQRLEGTPDLSIIVVDNGSTDDSGALIANALAEIPNSKLISLTENKGYAAGCNAGIDAVRHSQSAVSSRQSTVGSEQSSVGGLQSHPQNPSYANDDVPKSENLSRANEVSRGIRNPQRNHPSSIIHDQFLWLVNNDTVLDANALNALQNAATENPDVRIWGSTIRDIDHEHAKASVSRKDAKYAEVQAQSVSRNGEHHLQCSGGFQYFPALSIPIPLKFDPGKYEGQTCVRHRRLSYISGVSMFVRADVFDKGLMDESYFLYYEELELVRLAGGKQHIAWCPESVLYHKGGAATGGADPNRGLGSWAAHYYGNRSALKYTWRYYKIYFPFVFIFRFVVKSVLFILYGEWKGFRPMMKAFLTHPLAPSLQKRGGTH